MRRALALVLLTPASALVPAAFALPARAQATCQDRTVTIDATDGDDEIQGTPVGDAVTLGGGDDEFYGQGGDDVVCGGGGSDLIFGGDGNDSIDGGAGPDNMRGGTADVITFADARRSLHASLAAGRATWGDREVAFSAIEVLVGSRKADVLAGDGRGDYIRGAGGDVCATEVRAGCEA